MGLNRLISVSCVCVCVALCVEPVLEVEGEKEEKKRDYWKAQENQKFWLEKNNKERLKNNILIKIEFWDVGGIVKWDGIMIKQVFGMVKQSRIRIV